MVTPFSILYYDFIKQFFIVVTSKPQSLTKTTLKRRQMPFFRRQNYLNLTRKTPS